MALTKHSERWVETASFRRTPKGAAIELRVYVYPDGHGNLEVLGPRLPGAPLDCPVNDVGEAIPVLRALWTRLTRAHDRRASA